MSDFTPGPWKVADHNWYGVIDVEAIVNGHRTAVAQLHEGHHCWGGNARLIAAAPDLFSALDAMLARYDFGDTLPEDHPINAARAALLKARGGSSNEGE